MFSKILSPSNLFAFSAGILTTIISTQAFRAYILHSKKERFKGGRKSSFSSQNVWREMLKESKERLGHRCKSTHKRIAAGAVEDALLYASLPFNILPESYQHAGVAISSVIFSDQISKKVYSIMSKKLVSGLEKSGVYYSDIIDILVGKGQCRVYLFGGFIRDLFTEKTSKDLDFLFKSKQGNPVPYLKQVAESRGWPVYTKTDEQTGLKRWDFVAIGTKSSKGKFSGHECGTGCEGEFTMNTLLFDLLTGAIIDPTGQGVFDAVDYVLRIPYNRNFWSDWLTSDRLPGMRLLRYFNFVGRGYMPATLDLRQWVVEMTEFYFSTKEEMVTTLLVFLKRKIFVKNQAVAEGKEASFRNAVISEMVAAGRDKDKVQQWYEENILLRYSQVKKDSLPEVKQHILQRLNSCSAPSNEST